MECSSQNISTNCNFPHWTREDKTADNNSIVADISLFGKQTYLVLSVTVSIRCSNFPVSVLILRYIDLLW